MIKGFRGTSLVDYPGLVAAVVFFAGCNFRCPFCYNIDLVLPERFRALADISAEEIISELKRREGFIQGVVITGGEPTLSRKSLRHLLELIRLETGLRIKLDTNGSQPEVVAELWEARLLDYVAVDFKTSPSRYPELGGVWEPVQQTFSYLKKHHIPHELRLTVVPYFIGKEELKEMLPWLKGVPRVALQRFQAEMPHLAMDMDLGLYGPDELKALKSYLEEHLTGEVLLRHV